MTSQVGFLLIEYLNAPCNSDIICQNQVKLGTLTKQDEKFMKIYGMWLMPIVPRNLFTKYELNTT